MKQTLICLTTMLAVASSALCKETDYLRVHVAGEGNVEFNLGPTGIWGYGPHAQKRQLGPNYLVVGRVEAGSPAHGLVRLYDRITGANGKPFPAGEDPRYYLAHAIIDSEAKDGDLELLVTRGDKAIKVVVPLEIVPDYSPTWPVDCARTDTMLRNACEYLAREQMPRGEVVADDGYIGPTGAGLLWLAVGEPKYLENARRAAYWFADSARANELGKFRAWTYSYGALLLAEYYQMTGDTNVLADLEYAVAEIAKGQMPSGGWGHGFYSGNSAGYGEVNCAGMVDYMALLLAKECGVKVDEVALKKAEKYFEKFAPTLTNQYGDHMWAGSGLGYASLNGKVGGLAVAHRLNNRPVESAGYALKAARSMDTIESGHTGHFFNLQWSAIAASQAPARDYRSAMDQLGWYYALSRTWRGGLFCQPSDHMKYSKEGGQNMTTGGYGLSLAAARHRLRILGAPRSVFVQTLPAELKAARDLHQANKWDAAIAAVDAFLKKGGHDEQTIWRANDLRDKSRYVKEGMALTFTKLDQLSQEGKLAIRADKIEGMLKPLKVLLGGTDTRLLEIEKRLPDKSAQIWEHGKNYHEAFSTLRSLSIYNWFVFAGLLKEAQIDVSIPADVPVWEDLASSLNGKGQWKRIHVASPDKAPEGWQKLAFDDREWAMPTDRRRWPESGYNLVRVPFDFDVKATEAKQLRITVDKGVGLSVGAVVYLNGEKILSTESGVMGENVRLMKDVSKLLRPGRNVVSFVTANDKKGAVPQLKLQGELSKLSTFAWTPIPGRDEEFRKLVAERRIPAEYYEALKDTRTVKECMQVFNAEPFFMPETFYALNRFTVLLPEFADRVDHVDALLKSPRWGARWVGLFLICQAKPQLSEKDLGRMSKEQQASLKARSAAEWSLAELFIPQVIALLDDPHHQVRCQAATAVGLYGAAAKDSIPALTKLVGDLEGQNWFVRSQAWDALARMPLEETMKHAVARMGLKDPSSTVRRSVLDATLEAKNAAIREKAVQAYKAEMINQIFDAPHGMWTKSTRYEIALRAIKELSKDDLRPHIPRFLESLSRTDGEQLKGSMAILVSFGEEVRPKLEALAQDKNEIVRKNARMTLQGIIVNKTAD